MTYKYFAGWNSPGCLPDNPPEVFDNELAAREYMKDVFRGNADHFGEDDPHNSIAAEFDKFADDMEFHGDAAMGNGDSSWNGPDGLNYFIECHDVSDDNGNWNGVTLIHG